MGKNKANEIKKKNKRNSPANHDVIHLLKLFHFVFLGKSVSTKHGVLHSVHDENHGNTGSRR